MSNQVSWQSAFWALVPIAFNSMCQPCGNVLGLPSKYGFYLNSSPVVCATNALELVSKLVWRSCSMRSVEAAASLTANEIFEDVENPGGHDGLAQLQEIFLVRFIVFAGGTIPQVIKLYAMDGIPGTRICASLYLASWLAIELIMVWLKRYRSSLLWQNNGGSRFGLIEFPRTFSFFISISCSSVAFVVAGIAGIAGIKPVARSLLPYVDFLIIWTAMGLWSLLFAYTISLHMPSREAWPFEFYHLLLVITMLGGGLVRLIIPGENASLWDMYQALSTLRLLHILLIMIFFYATHLLGSRRAFRKRPKTQYCASIAFMLLHFLAAILSYAYEYDPQGTYKPSWTNNLG